MIESVFVHCMDGRIVVAVYSLYANGVDGVVFYDSTDMIAAAGGPALLLNRQHALWQSLDLAVRKHHVLRIVLIEHTDCGYRKLERWEQGLDPIGGEEELVLLSEVLRVVTRLIRERYGEHAPEVLGFIIHTDRELDALERVEV